MSDPALTRPMPRWRVIMVNALIAFLILGHLWDIKTRSTHWPFGHYEMFAHLYEKDDFGRLELRGVTTRGEEVQLADSYAAPMPMAHLELAFIMASWKVDPAVRHDALARLSRDFLRRYEANRRAGRITGPSLAGLRVYSWRWTHMDPWAANVNAPDSVQLIFETVLPKPPTTTQAAG